VKAYARLLGGLEAIGCETETAWATLIRIATGCAPALRTKVIRELIARPVEARTSEIAAAIETATKTASRYLEDLSILKLAVRRKQTEAANAPDLWHASGWLREHWPGSETDKYVHAHKTQVRQETDDEPDHIRAYRGTSRSHSGPPEPACAGVSVDDEDDVGRL
jgi:hypothetical protein